MKVVDDEQVKVLDAQATHVAEHVRPCPSPVRRSGKGRGRPVAEVLAHVASPPGEPAAPVEAPLPKPTLPESHEAAAQVPMPNSQAKVDDGFGGALPQPRPSSPTKAVAEQAATAKPCEAVQATPAKQCEAVKQAAQPEAVQAAIATRQSEAVQAAPAKQTQAAQPAVQAALAKQSEAVQAAPAMQPEALQAAPAMQPEAVQAAPAMQSQAVPEQVGPTEQCIADAPKEEEWWTGKGGPRPTPPAHLSPGAVDRRLRRVFAPKTNGTFKVPEAAVEEYKCPEKRSRICAMFEKCGYQADPAAQTCRS